LLFEVKGLKIDFDTPRGKLHAVRDISFSLKEGEILGIVGESGSGKSVTAMSLINLLPGNAQICNGSITYNGRSILDMNKNEIRTLRGKEVGMIFQEPSKSFDPIYSIGRSIKESILAHNDLDEIEIHERSLRLLKEVNVPKAEERLNNFPHQFSGGLLQRIMIAIALSCDPKVLIADEPTTALDVTIQSQIIKLLLKLEKRRHLSIVFITHDLSLISTIADRILVMYNGLVMEEGRSKDVLSKPLHPYTKALLDSHPRFGDHYSKVKLRTIPGNIPDPMKLEPGCPFEPRCYLAKKECKIKLPDIVKDKHLYRCIIKGVKK
jgi:oligopeptide/dipeptide ABC transporter ATP-binding protein